MGLPSTLVLEVNQAAGASDSNGGGFDPAVASAGVDYTYPNSVVYSYSDLVIQATNTQIGSTARAFTSADVGNTINVTAGTGFTVGRYSVRSVASGIATLDRAVGTAGSTGGTGVLGGALASPGMAGAVVVSNNTINIKNGTYLVTAATDNVSGGRLSLSAAGATTVSVRGYNATRGDTSATPIIRASGISGTYLLRAANGTTVYNIEFDCNSLTGMNAVSNFGSIGFVLCRFSNSLVQLNGNGTINYMERCVVINSGSGSSDLAGATIIKDCLFSNIAGASAAASASSLTGTVFIGCSAVCAKNSYVSLCDFYNNTGNLFFPFSGQLSTIEDCVAYAQTTAPLNGGSTATRIRNLALPSTLSTSSLSSCVVETTPISLTASPFVNPTATLSTASVAATLNDLWAAFALNNNAGGGAACRGAGAVPFQDIGAVQHATPALGLTVNTSGANPVLTWDADPRAVTGYVILRGTSASNLTAIDTIGLVTTYTDTTVSSGTYVYSVASY